MNRKLIMKAIVDEILKRCPQMPVDVVSESMKYIGDMDLVVFAQSLGIDTDAILSQGVQS